MNVPFSQAPPELPLDDFPTEVPRKKCRKSGSFKCCSQFHQQKELKSIYPWVTGEYDCCAASAAIFKEVKIIYVTFNGSNFHLYCDQYCGPCCDPYRRKMMEKML